MSDGLSLAIAVFFAAVGLVLIVWLLVSLTRRLRLVRAAQPPEERSSLWVLITAGLGAYLLAYFAFEGNLLAPWLLALAALAVVSVVWRLLQRGG